MRIDTNTGWRKPGPVFLDPDNGLEADKDQLFAAMRLAVQALKLRPSSRHVLDHLVGCWRGQKIAGKFLVWPSNEFLMQRTGLVERSIRYALAELVKQGLIVANESANGKRFAIRTTNGQIVDAYGFDLSPLLLLEPTHRAVVERMRIVREARDLAMDQITICRRSSRELLLALDAWSKGSAALWSEFESLIARMPRRDSNSPLPIEAWEAFKAKVMELYNAASGGNPCRLIKDNKDAPDQSCSRVSEMERRRPADVTLGAVLEACPDAVAYAGDITRPEHLIGAAGRLRGAFGVSQSGWAGAVDLLGTGAGAAFFAALQIYEADQRNRATIKNFGGYFVAMVRKLHAGEMMLADVLFDLRRRSRH